LNWAKEKLTAEEINKMLLAKNRDRYSLIHIAAGYGRLDRNYLIGLRKNLTTEEINTFLFATDRDGNTFIHQAAKYGRLDKLQNLFKWEKEKRTI